VIFKKKCNDGYAFFVNDVENALDTISRGAALWNARVLWSRCSRFLFNSYRDFALLMIVGTSIVCSVKKE